MLQYELDQITIKRFFRIITFELSSKFGGTVSLYIYTFIIILVWQFVPSKIYSLLLFYEYYDLQTRIDSLSHVK